MVAMMAFGAGVPLAEEHVGVAKTFEEVYAEHHLALLRFAAVVAGDRQVAEDAVAEVFARILDKRSWLAADDIGRYLRRCVVNEVKGRWRKEQRRSLVWGRLAPAGRRFAEAGGDGVVDDFAPAADQRRRILAAVSALPLQQRAVVVLRLYEDRSEAETAEILGVTAGTVKAALARARATLATLLKEGEGHVGI
jgi:RNA polymerase sigma factor (sigma-70 family)